MSKTLGNDTLLGRFPALARVRGQRTTKRVPFVAQLTGTDCGPASLAMVLAYLGKEVSLEQVRGVVGTGRDGSDAATLISVGRWFGLRGRGVSLDIEHLDYLQPGAILHWEFRHFVVFERRVDEDVEIVDPARGRRRVTLADFRRSFTGVAILFEPGEDFVPEQRPQRRFVRHLWRLLAETRLLSRIVVSSLFAQVCALAFPALTGLIIDRIVPRGDYSLLQVVAVGAVVLVGFNVLNSLVRAHLFLHLRTRLDALMTLDFIDHLVSLPYSFFQQRSAGDLMMRLNSNATVREILTSSVLSGVIDGLLVCVYMLLLLAASPGMGLLVVILGAARILLFLAIRQRQRDLLVQSLDVQAKSQSYQVEMLSGMEALKSMGVEHRAVERWSNLFVDSLNNSLERGRLSAVFDSILEALATLSPLAVLGFGTLKVLSGEVSLGTMFALSALASGFLGPLSKLVSTATQLQLMGTYLDRINDVLAAPREQADKKTRLAPRLRGNIKAETVSFRYAPISPDVLHDVSLEIEAGQMVAVVGTSGSGKSSLGKVLIGLHPPTSGRVFYDGADLVELDCRSVRNQWGIVTQSVHLFGGSIRQNISLADPTMGLEQVVEAAQLARLHDDITKMALGYDTPLADGGWSLSGGQRQRLALARALAHRPALLLLDEATSSLDVATEAAVQTNLANLGITRIIIAHRLSTVRNADIILVMESGRIVERGRHEDLLAAAGSYHRLVAVQSGSRDPSAR